MKIGGLSRFPLPFLEAAAPAGSLRRGFPQERPKPQRGVFAHAG